MTWRQFCFYLYLWAMPFVSFSVLNFCVSAAADVKLATATPGQRQLTAVLLASWASIPLALLGAALYHWAK